MNRCKHDVDNIDCFLCYPIPIVKPQVENKEESDVDRAHRYVKNKIAFCGDAGHSDYLAGLRDGRALAEENLWKELNKQNPTLHFCQEWDFMLIDNRHPEFEACSCGPFPLKYKD